MDHYANHTLNDGMCDWHVINMSTGLTGKTCSKGTNEQLDETNDGEAIHEDSPEPKHALGSTSATSGSDHPMITRRLARENAVNEDDELLFDTDYDENDVTNAILFALNDNHDRPDWAVAHDAQNSPPFVAQPLEDDDMEEGNIMNNIQIEPILPIQPGRLDQPIHPLRPAYFLPPVNPAIADLAAPNTPDERKVLVRKFREEVWKDEMKGMMRELGIGDMGY
ncbi:hypothetical protein QFC22_001645 [Naganishia vaughanmartiniae]|uniref:Uncharacterized protein n=1 Tax=Naganishia vaughanmartiniae TaxID=1424756 RepID=A0ACC2XF19_9TREE|nr:hypothetical protein QFC22_001645 [Naganishia vaughanmartiniae]